MSFGSIGCNFRCKHCQNWQISTAGRDSAEYICQKISPERAVEMAKQYDCSGIAWTYNEPGIWLGYTLDTAKLAKQNGLYTVYVTNGYSTPEALDAIGPYLDAWRVDIKGFSDSLYRTLSGVPRWERILEVTERAKNNWNMHIEVVTNIVPALNDDDAQLEGIAGWICEKLGELTPWHVTRFYPQHRMTDLEPTPVETLERACETGRKAGLKFIYAGNVPGHGSESTVCWSCGKTIIERYGYSTRITGLDGSKCKYCGAELNFRTAG
jgi:pyruvate formate lyase activating enzyme